MRLEGMQERWAVIIIYIGRGGGAVVRGGESGRERGKGKVWWREKKRDMREIEWKERWRERRLIE